MESTSEFAISEENETLFYHERKPMRFFWQGNYRGIGLEVVRWEWTDKVGRIASSFNAAVYNGYLYIDLENIPSKYGPSSFWIKPETFDWPILPAGEVSEAMEPTIRELNKTSKRANRAARKADSRSHKLYPYMDHPILRDVDLHGGLTYYEREFADDHRVIKIGCDWTHICDHPGFRHILGSVGEHYPVNLNMVLDDLRAGVDSFYKLVPEYGKTKND